VKSDSFRSSVFEGLKSFVPNASSGQSTQELPIRGLPSSFDSSKPQISSHVTPFTPRRAVSQFENFAEQASISYVHPNQPEFMVGRDCALNTFSTVVSGTDQRLNGIREHDMTDDDESIDDAPDSPRHSSSVDSPRRSLFSLQSDCSSRKQPFPRRFHQSPRQNHTFASKMKCSGRNDTTPLCSDSRYSTSRTCGDSNCSRDSLFELSLNTSPPSNNCNSDKVPSTKRCTSSVRTDNESESFLSSTNNRLKSHSRDIDISKRMNNFELNISSADVFELISSFSRGDDILDSPPRIVVMYSKACPSDKSSK